MRLPQGFAVGGEARFALLSADTRLPANVAGTGCSPGGGIAGTDQPRPFSSVNHTIGESSPTFMQWAIPPASGAGSPSPYTCGSTSTRPRCSPGKGKIEKPALGPAETPIAQVLRRQRRDSLTFGSAVCCFGFGLPGQHLLHSYAQTRTGYSRGSIPCSTVCCGSSCASCSPRFPLFMTNSGRRRVLLAAGVLHPGRQANAADRLRQPQLCSCGGCRHSAIGGFGFEPTASVHPRTVCY